MHGIIRLVVVWTVLAFVVLGSTPKIGSRAPGFTLPSSDGRTIALKNLVGKKLVLVFYRGYW